MQNIDVLYIEIYKKILESNNVLILTHTKPDGDCLGASRALSLFIDSIGKKNNILVTPKIPSNFSFLGIKNAINNYNYKDYDLFIILDANTLDRCNFVEKIDKNRLIIIDHHAKNDLFDNSVLNIIDDESSSTCEIIFNFLNALSIKINREIASSLLTGVLTDTNNFINQATNLNSIKISEKLISYGADTYLINKNINQNSNINIIKFLKIIISRIKVNRELNIASTYFSKDDLNDCNLIEDDIPDIANLLNNLYEYNFIMIIKQTKDNEMGFSLRTNKNIDLSKIAFLFNGGGHKKASGFKIKGNIKDLIF